MDSDPLTAAHMFGYDVEGVDKLFCKSKVTLKNDDIMSILQNAEVSDSSDEMYYQFKRKRLFTGGVPLIHKSQEKGNSCTSTVHSIAISSDLRDKKLDQPRIRNFLHEHEIWRQGPGKTIAQIHTQEQALVRDDVQVSRCSSKKLKCKQQNRKRRAAQSSEEDYHFARQFKRRIGRGEKVTLPPKRRRRSRISTLPSGELDEELTTTPAAHTDEDTQIGELHTTSSGLCTRDSLNEELQTNKRRSARIALLSQPLYHEEVTDTTVISAKSLSDDEASNESLIKDDQTSCDSQRKQLPAAISHPAETLQSELHAESGVSLAEAKETIKETLRRFSGLYMQAAVVPEDELVRTQKKGKRITADSGEPSPQQQLCRRPDLKALHIMMQSGPSRNLSNSLKPIGSIPGISVNHVFKSRAEMVVVGMHGRWMGGIDYIPKGGMSLPENADYALPLAVCIVIAGRYEDDKDFVHEIVYTGEGGNRDVAEGQRRRYQGRQTKDQELRRGNLGLSNSMRFGKPVRVVRKGRSDQSYSHALYTYAGLYEVHTVDCEKGVSGFLVFRFHLRRLPGQAQLTSSCQVNAQHCSSMST